MAITSSGDFDRVIVDRHVECEMRDGTILRADVYRPDDEPRRGNPSTIPESEWVTAVQQVWSGTDLPLATGARG
jgi:predicted acyl esterase